jgi:hypothetical protein
MAAGLADIPLLPLARAFLIGRSVSYTISLGQLHHLRHRCHGRGRNGPPPAAPRSHVSARDRHPTGQRRCRCPDDQNRLDQGHRLDSCAHRAYARKACPTFGPATRHRPSGRRSDAEADVSNTAPAAAGKENLVLGWARSWRPRGPGHARSGKGQCRRHMLRGGLGAVKPGDQA